jgi:hypothetical protein
LETGENTLSCIPGEGILTLENFSALLIPF